MRNGASRSGSKDKLLFTPGPLTTSMTVKQAMLRDLGSRDSEFIDLVKDIRSRLLEIGGKITSTITAESWTESISRGLPRK